ncbi:hypothetical protein CFC21_027471 [Triticum aestivum]|uniref:F-box domain-containing protein n=3 Tax=Triticinae TaxID=1648030 RepID=A0A9R1JDD6_WHEAT|nr:putative F-box protein At1g12855 [Aegilops tauschii subsp. strangulata]XP_044329919.1 putative F-box protein At1g12855 [Triticum aestivum]KAF7013385.1 hypothetical protein CFC21_027471 [Triticum aestivum]
MLLRSGLRVGVATHEEAGRATVPGRRSRAGPDRLADFPEDILQEILVHLPAKSVLRCRAVCRQWRRLASDPVFLLDHHRRQPELALISSYRTSTGDYPSLEALHLRGAEFRPLFGFPELSRFPLTVDGSCDGLFIVGHYICNPATRQSATVSPNLKLPIDKLIGLFRHQPSGEYRVLYWRNLPYALSNLPWHVMPCPHEYRVLTVGTNKSWRVDCPLMEVIAERPAIFGAPVLLNGNLHIHWRRPSGVRYHKILMFDTTAETFRRMIPPAVNPHHVMHLLDMGGKLAASISKDDTTVMSIFILKNGDVWAFQYQIKVPVMDLEKRFQEQQGNWWAKVVSEEGDVLVSCYGQLLHCDKGGNLVANFKVDDEMPVVVPHRLKESLIQHTFFLEKS